MRLIRFSLVCAAAMACADPTDPQGKPAPITALPRQLNTTEQALAASTTGFGIGLLREVNKTFADSNVFISPLSATMALGMTLNGASNSTYDEMRGALNLPDRPLSELNASYQGLVTMLRGLDKTVDFRIANSIWYRNSFASAVAPAFLADTRTFFDAEASGLDFASPQALTTINSWVNTSTNGKITKILDQIPPELVMYLINATYFKGAWRDSFDPQRTGDGPFTTHRGQQVTAKLMTRKGGYRAAQLNGTQVVELPYGGDAFVMTVAMPALNVDINTFIASLTPATWASFSATLTEPGYDLVFPKFKLEWEDRLNNELQALGMRQAFIEGGADFTRLSPTMGRDLYVSEVKQKTFVDVNEEGTEAAAVTSVGIGVTSLPPSIRIDRPFVFAIRERLSGTVLFIGKIVRP
ncbi:MAG: serpin family protein [Gemmatimonadetes bacterium]|nr:serpin family protein [Gemmatimonadota bacterium]